MQTQDFISELEKYANDSVAMSSQRFFKTGKDEYGEGDVFIGARVPDIRKVCRQFKNLSLSEVKKLLESEIHEHRLAAVIILRAKYQLAGERDKQQIYELYMHELANGKINNWDIVDISCGSIVGQYNRENNRDDLYKLAKSNSLWEKRVAMISTSAYIDSGEAGIALDIADILLNDQHDLIHKAVGWMLREVGKRVDEAVLADYLEKNAAIMPRTMLRYACEKLSSDQRNYFYNLKSNNLTK